MGSQSTCFIGLSESLGEWDEWDGLERCGGNNAASSSLAVFTIQRTELRCPMVLTEELLALLLSSSIGRVLLNGSDVAFSLR